MRVSANVDDLTSSSVPDPQALQAFLTAYRQCRTGRDGGGAYDLAPPVVQRLSDWLITMRQPLIEARWAAHACDPWEVAGLGRDELRNSRVLAWILDPRGSHGLGSCALDALWCMLDARLGAAGLGRHDHAVAMPAGTCQVHTEACVDGDQGSRVDIEIDHDAFYLLIEVKIDAQEGLEQLDRYGSLARRKAGSRPWALVFLTPHGRIARTAVVHADRVVPLAWSTLGRHLDAALSRMQRVRRHDRAAGPSQVMAEQAVSRFLQRVCQF